MKHVLRKLKKKPLKHKKNEYFLKTDHRNIARGIFFQGLRRYKFCTDQKLVQTDQGYQLDQLLTDLDPHMRRLKMECKRELMKKFSLHWITSPFALNAGVFSVFPRAPIMTSETKTIGLPIPPVMSFVVLNSARGRLNRPNPEQFQSLILFDSL